jgi:hypothetical protein
VKTPNEENLCQGYLADKRLHELLEKVDSELAEKVHKGGCLHCSGKLHRAKYKRKPRGGAKKDEQLYRASFCCNQDGCRIRHTPPSVRFLGRRVYWGLVVVLVSAMHHGLKPERVEVLREQLGVDRRTLERWREWWLETFVQSSLWKMARAWFMPLLCEKTLPLSLCQAYHAFQPKRRDRLLEVLRFLSPITTISIPLERTW